MNAALRTAFLSSLLLVWLLAAAGCVSRVKPAEHAEERGASEPEDDLGELSSHLAQRIRTLRADLRERPGDVRLALRFAILVQTGISTGLIPRTAAVANVLVREGIAALDRAAHENPEQRASVLAIKGEFLLGVGYRREGREALESSMETRPNLSALQQLLPLLQYEKQDETLREQCQRTRPHVREGDERYALLELCARYSGKSKAEEALAWASEEDRTFFSKETEVRRAKKEAELAEFRRAAEEARRTRSESASVPVVKPSEGAAPASSAAGLPLEVEFRNRCPQRVELFAGEAPGKGGTSFFLGPPTRRRLRSGERVWIIDSAKGTAKASLSLETGMQRVEVRADCTSFAVEREGKQP